MAKLYGGCNRSWSWKISNSRDRIPVFNHQDCPFRLCDMPLPQCGTGFVYMLVRIRDISFCYIGETKSLSRRLREHDSGCGSHSTAHISLRSFALFAYVCGFDGNVQLFEREWKKMRDEEFKRCVYCVKQISRLASSVISRMVPGMFGIDRYGLRLILHFDDEWYITL